VIEAVIEKLTNADVRKFEISWYFGLHVSKSRWVYAWKVEMGQ
jgi:hypothetical protein